MLTKTKSGIPYIEVLLALSEAAKCGCGLDCANGQLVLPNFNSVSGDIDGYHAIYIVDGVITSEPVADARETIAAFCENTAITATSASISGCLPLVNLVVGLTRQLTATVLPSGAVQTGIWTTSAAGVATVSVAGLVTAVAAGTATITFTSTDGGFTATCVVTVVAA